MDTINWLIRECEKAFCNNLLCLLLIGSAQRDDTNPFSDIDVIAVIKTMEINQMNKLRLSLRLSEGLFDCSILCQDEFPKNPDDFCLGSHGCYQLELVLKRAKCVWGQNVLMQLGHPSECSIRASVAHKIAEYTWWLRRILIESNRERSLEANYKINSRLVKMIRDILYLRGYEKIVTEPTANVIKTFLSEYLSEFTSKEQQVVIGLGDSANTNINTANMSDAYLLIRCSIANKIYKQMTKIIYL